MRSAGIPIPAQRSAPSPRAGRRWRARASRSSKAHARGPRERAATPEPIDAATVGADDVRNSIKVRFTSMNAANDVTEETLETLVQTRAEEDTLLSVYLDLDPHRFATPRARASEID